MDMSQLEKILSKEPGFRLKQIKQALFCDLIDNWEQATVLPLVLRQKLEKVCSIGIQAKNFISQDGATIKAIITLADGLKIESVLMRHSSGAVGSSLSPSHSNPVPLHGTPGFAQNQPRPTNRNTVCVSSQVGCQLACVFCATGQMGFKRNLTAWEIAEQVLFFVRYLKKESVISPFIKGGLRGILKNKSTPPLLFKRREENKINSVVFMGMGEPFLNYENVLAAIKILNNKDGLNIGARHISISTAGIVEGIDKLAQEPLQINLAISLHAPDDKLRSQLMPINKKYPLVKILAAIDKYIFETRRKVMFEYIMIKDVNDSEECARRLAKIAGQPLCFVNLISYNPTGIFSPSPEERIKKFKKILEKKGVAATRRFRFGDDIQAACGQLIPHLKK